MEDYFRMVILVSILIGSLVSLVFTVATNGSPAGLVVKILPPPSLKCNSYGQCSPNGTLKDCTDPSQCLTCTAAGACVPGGLTGVSCTSPSDCFKNCNIITGSCMVGGTGKSCTDPLGSECMTCNSSGRCAPGGTGKSCNGDSDCTTCNSLGKCVNGGPNQTGKPCKQDVPDCLPTCSVDGTDCRVDPLALPGDKTCVFGQPASSQCPTYCSEDGKYCIVNGGSDRPCKITDSLSTACPTTCNNYGQCIVNGGGKPCVDSTTCPQPTCSLDGKQCVVGGGVRPCDIRQPLSDACPTTCDEDGQCTVGGTILDGEKIPCVDDTTCPQPTCSLDGTRCDVEELSGKECVRGQSLSTACPTYCSSDGKACTTEGDSDYRCDITKPLLDQCQTTCTGDGLECKVGGGGIKCNNEGDCPKPTCSSDGTQCKVGGDSGRPCDPTKPLPTQCYPTCSLTGKRCYIGASNEKPCDPSKPLSTECPTTCSANGYCGVGGGGKSCDISNNNSDCPQPTCSDDGTQCYIGGLSGKTCDIYNPVCPTYCTLNGTACIVGGKSGQSCDINEPLSSACETTCTPDGTQCIVGGGGLPCNIYKSLFTQCPSVIK